MLKQIFILQHWMRDNRSGTLHKKGKSELVNIFEDVRDFLDATENALIIYYPVPYIKQSARVVREVLIDMDVSSISHPGHWEGYDQPQNHARMYEFIMNNARKTRASTVILLTNQRGISGLRRKFKKESKHYCTAFKSYEVDDFPNTSPYLFYVGLCSDVVPSAISQEMMLTIQ